MAWLTFGTQTSPEPMSNLDVQFANVAAFGTPSCTASGTNVITLTPTLTGYTGPAYANYVSYRFVAANSTTAAVTLKVGALAALNVYVGDNTTQATLGNIVAGRSYQVTYNSALNSGAGGWLLLPLGDSAVFWSWTTNSSLLLDTFAPSVGHDATYQQQVSANGATAFFGGYFNFGGVNIKGYQAFIGYSKSSQLPTPLASITMTTAGSYFIGENDNSADPTIKSISTYGVYAEGRAGNDQFTTAIEADNQNTSGNDARKVDPFNMFGVTADTGVGKPVNYALWCYPGGTKVPLGANNASAAIGIQGDGTSALHKRGIVIGNNAIAAVAGHKIGLYMPIGVDIAWLASSGGTIGYLATADAITLIWGGKFNSVYATAPQLAANTTGASQQALVAFQAANTEKWSLGKNTDETFILYDTAATAIALTVTTAASFAFSLTVITAASATGKAGFRIPSGTAPTSPVSGDMWFDGTDVKFRVGGTTKTFTLT